MYRDNIGIIAVNQLFPSVKDTIAMALTFSLTVFAWIFFRAENVGHAFSYISGILSPSLFSSPYFPGIGLTVPTIILTFIFILIEWQGREGQFAIQNLGIKWKRPLRYAMYYAIFIAIFWGFLMLKINPSFFINLLISPVLYAIISKFN